MKGIEVSSDDLVLGKVGVKISTRKRSLSP